MMDEKESLLRETMQAVAARAVVYGSANHHFARTIGAINAMFKHKFNEDLTPSDWAMMMMIDKIAREQHTPKRDNAVDIAGYAACLAQCRIEEGKYEGSKVKQD